MSSSGWINPQGQLNGGNGGGETPKEVNWSDIKGKPKEFTPKEHTHSINEVDELDASLKLIEETLADADNSIKLLQDNKVDKVNGKQLSTNDYTNEEKEMLNDLAETTVKMVNLQTPVDGNVTLTKRDLNLGNVQNIEQASKEEFEQAMERINSDLKEKVNKVEGKQLSTNDFTNEHKKKLEELGTTEGMVKSVANQFPDDEGNIQISAKDIGLDKIENITYTPYDEFMEHARDSNYHLSAGDRDSINRIPIIVDEVNNKVNKEFGKQLTTNDLTDELKEKYDDTATMLDKHIVDKELHLTDKDREAIENVKELNIEELNQKLENKVDKVEGKELSTNDFMDSHKENVEKIPATLETLQEHLKDAVNGEQNHLSPKDREQLQNLEAIEESQEEINTRITDLVANVSNHHNNKEIHVAPEERENINKIPSIQDDIEALEKALGEGGNTPSDTIFEELVEGKIYKLGDTIYDVIHGNKISGDLSLRFFNDNKDSFLEGNIDEQSGRTRLVNNHFIVSATGFYADMADYLNENNAFQGMLTKIIDLKSAGLPKVTINGSEHSNDKKMATVFQDNIITMEINPRHILVSDEYTYSPKQTAKVSLNFDYHLNIPKGIGMYSVAHQVVANRIHFTEYEDFAINVKGTIDYTEEEFAKAGDKTILIEVKGQLYDNDIKVCEKTKYGDIIYNLPDAELYIDEIYESGEPYNYVAGLSFQVAHNTFDRETARRFTGELTYTSERMKQPQQPIFKNIHLNHYLNAAIDTAPKVNDLNILDREVSARSETKDLKKANLKNIAIIQPNDSIENIPDGTIVVVLDDETV